VIFSRKRKPSDFKAEVETHLELEADRLKERGLTRRKREIGIRMALGCTTSQAMAHVEALAVRASALRLTLALILAAVALRTIPSVLYGAGVYEVPTILVVLTLASVTLISTTMPTWRTARVDPQKRCEPNRVAPQFPANVLSLGS
jgi:FtsX-like permease family protein